MLVPEKPQRHWRPQIATRVPREIPAHSGHPVHRASRSCRQSGTAARLTPDRARIAPVADLHLVAGMLPPLEGIVYGPVRSRRLGRSLGINLLPAGMKVCNMNCAYCQYGWTRGAARYRGQGKGWPSAQAVAMAAQDRLARAADDDELVDRITVAGHGEPTLHPEFEDVTERLREVRDRVAPGIPIALLSNSTTASWPDVRRALALYDERYMKLDAGDPITYASVNGAGPGLTAIVDSLRSLPTIVVQSMFITESTHQIDNSTEGAVHEWLRALETIRAIAAHIYTIDRAPALATLRPVPRRRLREIAERVRAVGIPAEVFTARTVRAAP
jgi:wyosine [tRNA(Phe)-imidazoG37] synthetase (radical SAM superfamily)